MNNTQPRLLKPSRLPVPHTHHREQSYRITSRFRTAYRQIPKGPSLTHTVVPTAPGGAPPGDRLADGEEPPLGEADGPGVVGAGMVGWIGGGHVAAELVSGVPTLVVGDGVAGELPGLAVLPVAAPGPLRLGPLGRGCRLTGVVVPGGSLPWGGMAPALGVCALACVVPASLEPVASGG